MHFSEKQHCDVTLVSRPKAWRHVGRLELVILCMVLFGVAPCWWAAAIVVRCVTCYSCIHPVESAARPLEH